MRSSRRCRTRRKTEAERRAERSRTMSRIRGRLTGPELALGRALWSLGEPFEYQPGDLPGRPDFLVGRVAVFVDGCLWHRCPLHWRPVKDDPDGFWRRKFGRNVERDREVNSQLRRAGVPRMRVWEHAVKAGPAAAARRVQYRREMRGE